MADPELSLQSMLMVGAVLGRGKAAAYVALVAAFSTAAGLLHGASHDGAAWAGWAIRLAPFAVAALLLGAWRARRGRAAALAMATATTHPPGDER